MKSFLEVARTVYADDPKFVMPLDIDVASRLSPRHPHFEHSEGTAFVAYDGGRPVGRIVAHVNHAHLTRHDDGVGFFGFIDTVDDEQVASGLLDRAADWLRRRQLRVMRGPITMNMAEEVGCLVEGFEFPPMLRMPHHRPHQARLIEGAGLQPVRTLNAWRYTTGEVPERARRGHRLVSEMANVRVRQVDTKRLRQDVEAMLDIYNDAWGEAWGFVPLTPKEARTMASELRFLIVPELSRLVYIDGEPAAFAYALPNVNEMLTGLDGKLLPLGFLKLAYRLKVRGPRTARLVGLGIRSKFRKDRRYMGLSAYLYVEMNEAGRRLHIPWGELSYVDEANSAMNAGVKMMGAELYKKSRVFERQL